MHRVEHIGLAHAVEARETVEPWGKVEGLRRVTFEIREFELGEVHGAKFVINDEMTTFAP